ncbi:MAG TPA: DinB family protein [Candidatus Methylomirabilis sp.]|jgi:uncharacterized damage-inducible protein DinB
MDMRTLLIANKEAVRARTRNLFPKIPADKMTWAPDPKALTLGQLIRHVRLSEAGLLDVVRKGSWWYLEERIGPALTSYVGPATDKDAEIKQFEDVHAATIAFVREAPEEVLEREYRSERLNRTLKGWALILGIAEHEAHHRGQMATYLRLLGDPTPSPYGPY